MTIYLSKEPIMMTSKIDETVYVLIFKTNIHLKEDLKIIEECFQGNKTILDWHIDQEYIDNVLRIESTIDNTNEIIKTITQAGFFCEELD